VFNQYGQVIGIVREQIVSSAELNLAITSNVIYEALELKTDDHPNGFDLGLTQGLELRTSGEIDADWALENAARIEAENKERASKGPSPAELSSAAHDAEIRASNGTNSEGQVKYCHCTFFCTCHAGARPYRVLCQVARCDMGPPSQPTPLIPFRVFSRVSRAHSLGNPRTLTAFGPTRRDRSNIAVARFLDMPRRDRAGARP
jgi:hypothetical protein